MRTRKPSELARRRKEFISLMCATGFSAARILQGTDACSIWSGQVFRAKGVRLSVGTHGDGVACGSVSGPPNLESVAAIHREVPTIPLDPPGNGPDVTQIKNFRQHMSSIFWNGGHGTRMRKTDASTVVSKERSPLQK